jgi:quercetin dioxygenase-like cupin family protein
MDDGLPFAHGRVAPRFELRTVTVTPGPPQPFEPADWADALVLVKRGELWLETRSGERWRFREGDVLWLADLPLRALENPGPGDTLLLAVSRRHP